MRSEVPPRGEGRCPYCGFWHVTNERKCCLAARDLEAAISRERELEAQLDDEKAKVRGLRAELGLVKARVVELERDAKQARDLLRRSRRYVIAHDYTRRGMLTGPPPVGGVLRDLIAAIDAAMAGEE